LLHKLRGAAAQLGLEALAQIATEAERLAVEAGDPSSALPGLRHTLQETLAAIERLASESAPATAGMVATEEARALDPTHLPQLLQLAQALETDDIAAMEPLLDQLATVLPLTLLTPLRQAVESYDFNAAKQLVQAAIVRLQSQTEDAS
jgi:HPt (histidine-containing phosphotransfer) domain-containing protein